MNDEFSNEYTHFETTLNQRNNNLLYDRHQADYDYTGGISQYDDPADHFRPVKAVRIA